MASPFHMVDWNAKYRMCDGLLYGDKPCNIVVLANRAYADRLGHVLCLGDGEGRQSRALAQQGHEVTSIDISEVATHRARMQDQKRGLQITRLVRDATQPPKLDKAADSCFMCFLHFSAVERQACFTWLSDLLPVGGLLFIEGFGPDQPAYDAKYQSGGPAQIDLLYDAKQLKLELTNFTALHQSCAAIQLDDGPGHQGLAQIVQMIFQKTG